MPRLEEMTFAQRFLLTLFIVLVILFALAAFGYFSGGWEDQSRYGLQSGGSRIVSLAGAQERVELYTDVLLDMRLLQLDKRALDEAYHNQLLKLWTVWLQGGAQDPTYFQNGLGNARRAYNMAAKQISDRESILFEREQRRQQEQATPR